MPVVDPGLPGGRMEANSALLALPPPFLLEDPVAGARTGLVVAPRPDAMPAVAWAGPVPHAGLDPAKVAALVDGSWECALLPEHATGWFGRPGLSGHRLHSPGGHPAAGRDWSPDFRPVRIVIQADGDQADGDRAGGDRAGGDRAAGDRAGGDRAGGDRAGGDRADGDRADGHRADGHRTDGHRATGARIEAADEVAGLALVTEIEAAPGGAIRARHTLTNTGEQPYVVNCLEIVFPLPGEVAETLDFTGRWASERVPQRRVIADGLWLREGRRGQTGHDSATVLVAGTVGFGFVDGRVWGLHVAWSGNTVHRVERLPSGLTTIGGGELLLPGEITLDAGQSYATPWVFLAAAADGLDGLAALFHGYLRSLPAHPRSPRPVNLNVWEAVTFDHDLSRLTALADIAADLGVERYVLDDGWFHSRRDDTAGLGDWWVDETVWPGGLHPLVDHVRARGMEFGLWFEPEMVNPDSDLYRAHPDWILSTGGRVPPLQRTQLVLDLSRPEVAGYLLDRMDGLLSEYDISYVKWDHNRDLVDAGSAARAGAPAVHAQTLAVYALLDELRRRHPEVEWESCASGGGRVDLGILERTERIWVSDMTDALARQSIQRWTGQLVPPEYCGAHVSAPVAHQTGRHLPLALRAATALFGHFGIEWDLTTAGPASLAELGGWVRLYKKHRALIHSGRVTRADAPDGTALMHGVAAADRGAALMSYVQLDEPIRTQAVALRIPGLDPARLYRVTDVTPEDSRPARAAAPVITGAAVSGALLGEIGVAIPVQRPHTVLILFAEAT